MGIKSLIVEDGTCVHDANTWKTVEDGRDYWSLRFGGEPWDLSFAGKNYCDADICKALIGAADYLRCLDWNSVCCPKSCLPSPVQCDCYGKPAHELLGEAQLLVADAILKGWNGTRQSGGDVLVKSWSSPEEGSVAFAKPVEMSRLSGCNASSEDIGKQLMGRLQGLIGQFLKPQTRRRVIC